MPEKIEAEIKDSGNSTLKNVANPQIVNLIVIDSPLTTVLVTLFTSLFSLINSQQNGREFNIEPLIQTLNTALEEDKKQRENDA